MDPERNWDDYVIDYMQNFPGWINKTLENILILSIVIMSKGEEMQILRHSLYGTKWGLSWDEWTSLVSITPQRKAAFPWGRKGSRYTLSLLTIRKLDKIYKVIVFRHFTTAQDCEFGKKINEVSSTVALTLCPEAFSGHCTGSRNPDSQKAQKHRLTKGLRPIIGL